MTNTLQNPLSSNRGVETLRKPYNITIDWLSATFPLRGLEDTKTIHQALIDILGIQNDVVDVITPRRGFMNAVQLQIGRLDLQPNGLDGFIGFQLTGSEMKEFRDKGGQEKQTLERLLARKGKPSRLDIAIDILDDPRASISDLESSYRTGEIKTKAKAARLIEDMLTGGKTLYIGSRQSQTFFRAYDKAIESGNLGELWTRLELEVKNKASKQLCEQIAKLGLRDSARWWFEKFRFNADWYRDMLRTMDINEPTPLDEPPTDKKRWLETQVLPALRKLSDSEPDTLAWFLQAVNAEFSPSR